MNEKNLIDKVKSLLPCDAARVTRFPGRMFLIVGYNRRSEGTWFQRGGTRIAMEPGATAPKGFEPVNFDYVEEHVIANGRTLVALWEEAKHYVRLSKLSGIDAVIEELKHRGCPRKRLAEIRKVAGQIKVQPDKSASNMAVC